MTRAVVELWAVEYRPDGKQVRYLDDGPMYYHLHCFETYVKPLLMSPTSEGSFQHSLRIVPDSVARKLRVCDRCNKEFVRDAETRIE
jgi:hypothetical protein